jgi:glycosyltransferase involved in cell wall biosynthesis
MRVVHLVDSGGLYGAEAVLLALATHQQRRGLTAIIVSIGSPGCGEKPLEQEAVRRGVPIHRVRMADGPNVFGAMKLVALAQRAGADILHSHGYKTNILLGFLPRRVRRLPLISTVHGYTNGRGFDRLRLYKWLDRQALRRCDRVVLVHSDMTATAGLDLLDPRRVRVIENGIGDDGLSSPPDDADRCIVDFCRHRPVVGAVGRLSPEKGFDHLITAFGRLAASGSEARLVILGEGPERSALERAIADKDLGDRVLLPGFVKSGRYLPLFDVFVQPSLTEGLPLSVLEAMRAGVPVVASRVGGVPQVLSHGEGGLLVEPGDVQGLERAVAQVLSDQSLAQRLVQTSKAMVRDFSSERMTNRYLEVYAELVAADAPRRDDEPSTIRATRSRVS